MAHNMWPAGGVKDMPLPTKNLKNTSKNKRWLIFFLAFFTYFTFYLCRTNMPYASKTLINLGLLNVTSWGTLVSISAIFYGISKGVSGMLADKFSLRKILLFGLGVTACINLFIPVTFSSKQLFCLWLINQCVQGLAYTSCVRTILNWYGSKKNKAYTYWSASHRFGTSVTGFIATACISVSWWQGTFIIPAIITFLMFCLVWFKFQDTPSQDERLSLALSSFNPTQDLKKPSFVEICKYIFTNKNLLILAITSMGIYYGYFFILHWLVIFFTDNGFSITQSTGMLSFLPLLGCFGGIASGYIIDGFFKGRILPTIINSLVVVALLLVILPLYISSLTVGSIILIMLLLGFFTDIPQILGSLASTNFVEPRFQGSGLGFVGLWHYIGVSISGVTTAYLVKNFSWNYAFATAIFMLFITIAGCVILLPHERVALSRASRTDKKEPIQDQAVSTSY